MCTHLRRIIDSSEATAARTQLPFTSSFEKGVRKRVAALYRARADEEEGLMAENLFRSAAAYAEDGRPFR